MARNAAVAGRTVYRLTYRSCKNAGTGRVGIQLTGDHPVLTERGYVPVAELRDGDRVATGQGLCQPRIRRGVRDGAGRWMLPGRVLIAHDGPTPSGRVTTRGFKADLVSEFDVHVEDREIAAVAGGEATRR